MPCCRDRFPRSVRATDEPQSSRRSLQGANAGEGDRPFFVSGSGRRSGRPGWRPCRRCRAGAGCRSSVEPPEQPYFFLRPSPTRRRSAASPIRACASTGSPRGLPRTSQGCTVTRPLLRIRLTLPVSVGVQNASAGAVRHHPQRGRHRPAVLAERRQQDVFLRTELLQRRHALKSSGHGSTGHRRRVRRDDPRRVRGAHRCRAATAGRRPGAAAGHRGHRARRRPDQRRAGRPLPGRAARVAAARPPRAAPVPRARARHRRAAPGGPRSSCSAAAWR